MQGEAGGADWSVSALIKTPGVAAAPGEETKKKRECRWKCLSEEGKGSWKRC